MSAKKKAKEDLRLPDPEDVDQIFPGHGEKTVKDIAAMFEARTKLDPKGRVWREIAVVFAPIIDGTASAELKSMGGSFFVKILEEGDPALAKRIFESLLSMMGEKAQNEIEQPHRNARAMRAYTTFVTLYGADPSKPLLKAFIRKNPEKLGVDWPPDDDKKGWTRVWEESGLSQLEDR